jgi:hypothetical protein
MTGYFNVIEGTSVVGVVSVSNSNFATFLRLLMLHKYIAETFGGHYRGKFSRIE